MAESGGSAGAGGGVGHSGDYGQNHVVSVVSGTAVWSAEEDSILRAGLQKFSSSEFDQVGRYVRIAAELNSKSVRDVAHRVREMSAPPAKRPKQANTTPVLPTPVVGREDFKPVPVHLIMGSGSHGSTVGDDNPAAAAAAAAGLPAPTSETFANPGFQALARSPVHSNFAMASGMGLSPAGVGGLFAGGRGASRLKLTTGTADDGDDDAGFTPDLVPVPPPNLPPKYHRPDVVAKLQTNLRLISKFRSNLLAGRLHQNVSLMAEFRDNTRNVLEWLDEVTEVEMPAIPVQLNTSLLPPAPSSSEGKQTTKDSGSMPPPPPSARGTGPSSSSPPGADSSATAGGAGDANRKAAGAGAGAGGDGAGLPGGAGAGRTATGPGTGGVENGRTSGDG